MAKDHGTQPEAGQAAQRVKNALRTAQEIAIDGLGTRPVASDLSGHPVFAIEDDLPAGATSATLENGAITLCGHLAWVPEEELGPLAARYGARHGSHDGEGSALRLARLSLQVAEIGGESFAADALLTEGDGPLALYERRAVDHMNDDHLDAVKNYAEVLLGAEKGEWRLASLDMEGLDLVRCDAAGADFKRLWFDPPLAQPGDIKGKLVELAMAGRA
ncbi:MAG: DUF2470 domain-containing protein [Pseudomonadota bacterium]